MNEEELYHYGIKGMKWGIRRTPQQLGHKTKKSKEDRMSDDAKKAKSLKKKKVYELSNSELKELNKRLNMEKQYRDLNPSVIKKGVKFVAATGAFLGSAAALYNNANNVANIAKKLMK